MYYITLSHFPILEMNSDRLLSFQHLNCLDLHPLKKSSSELIRLWLNFHSSPTTAPNHWWGAGPFSSQSPCGRSSRPACCCPPARSRSGSWNEAPPELLPPKPRSGSSSRAEDAAGDVSLLSNGRTPLPELHSLLESAPSDETRREGWTDGERSPINKHHMRISTLPKGNMLRFNQNLQGGIWAALWPQLKINNIYFTICAQF